MELNVFLEFLFLGLVLRVQRDFYGGGVVTNGPLLFRKELFQVGVAAAVQGVLRHPVRKHLVRQGQHVSDLVASVGLKAWDTVYTGGLLQLAPKGLKLGGVERVGQLLNLHERFGLLEGVGQEVLAWEKVFQVQKGF